MAKKFEGKERGPVYIVEKYKNGKLVRRFDENIPSDVLTHKQLAKADKTEGAKTKINTGMAIKNKRVESVYTYFPNGVEVHKRLANPNYGKKPKKQKR